MYNVTVKRSRHSKKVYKRSFNTLSQLAKFMAFSERSVVFPKIDNELSERERIILLHKLVSLLGYMDMQM